MSILYKYYSSALDIESYLRTPTMRLSQTSILNDPFEGKISKSVMDIIIERIRLDPELLKEENQYVDDDTDRELVKKVIEETMRSVSVIAMTETQRNLLMWSHYASEHRGCCIGYQKDLFSGIPVEDEDLCYSYEATKVNYDGVVFDDEQILLLDNHTPLTNDDINNIIKKAITTKGDAWLYEKEHRFIIPLEWCDSIIIRSIGSIPEYIKPIFNKIKKSNYITKIRDQVAYISPPSIQPRDKWNDDTNRSFENMLSPYKETMFLKKIDKSLIKSIYLGIHYPKTKELSLIEMIKNKSNGLDHIQIYRQKLSDERFELTSVKLRT